MLIEAVHCDSCRISPPSTPIKPWCACVTELRDHILSLCDPSDVDKLKGSGEPIWEVLKKYLNHQETNAQFWWDTTGPLLAVLLHEAKYHVKTQFEVLLFYFCFLAPALGPRVNFPDQDLPWKSFMTDTNVPIELSWEWGLGHTSPLVRLSIEPIGLDAGAPKDPLNEHATLQLVDGFQRIFPGTDLSLFHHFSKALLTYNLEDETSDATPARAGHRSRSFVAFDFGKTGMMLKAYFFPIFKAMETGQSSLTLISGAITQLAKIEGLQYQGYDCLANYIQTSPEGAKLEAEMLSVDCVSPASSRMKIYLRSQSTSFDSVRANMTLGGTLESRNLEKGMLELEKLWKLVLLPARSVQSSEELPHKAHRTAGILYYYDIGPEQSVPTPRVYIPVRHYGRSDSTIADGLTSFLKGRGQDEMVDRYRNVLGTAYPQESLDNECGAQTYVGCTIVNGALRITSYLAPRL